MVGELLERLFGAYERSKETKMEEEHEHGRRQADFVFKSDDMRRFIRLIFTDLQPALC